MPLASGAAFAGYTIVRLLGSGGMGEVYLAQHPRLPRQDALKILRTDVSADEDYRQRFIREADLAAKLWHPNIVQVHDRGEFNGQLWIAMDFVDGTDAASLLRDRYPVGMPAGEVAMIIAAIASALDYAHAHDLLHRDVKPANILLSNPGDGDQRILLSDFGIARNIGDMSGLTATNMTVGTVAYAAPEQLMGEDIDGRADQYALAATAYHLLTGSTLFPQTNPAAVISHHLSAPPPALADTRPGLAAFDPVLAVALAKDPADRFAQCTDFAQAFAEAAHSGRHATASAPTRSAPSAGRPPESAAVPSARADTDKQKRRRRGILLGAAVAVVMLAIIGVIGYMVQPKKHPTPTAGPAPAPPPATHAPPQPVLDGTYRLDYDNAHQTINDLPNPQPTTRSTTWWAFRSSCTSTGCVATGTGLDKINHQVAGIPAATDILHFADNHWQDSTPMQDQKQFPRCLGADGKSVVAGADTETNAWSLEPQPDGTLRGVLTVTALTNECGNQGTVWRIPFVATRIGDVPPGVTVADPATVTPSATASIPARVFGGPVLDGTFRLDFDDAHQTVNGVPVSRPVPNETEWWAFRSQCTDTTDCVATGSKLVDTNHQAAAGVPIVLHFVDGHWEDTPYLQPPHQCPGTNGTDTETISRSLEPQPDGTLRGVITATALTNECGNQGKVWRTPTVATRMGDVPPSVILADPGLF